MHSPGLPTSQTQKHHPQAFLFLARTVRSSCPFLCSLLDLGSTSPWSTLNPNQHSQNASGREGMKADLPMGGGGTGENQNHNSRVTPDNPAFQRLAELEGTLPLTSKPTTSSCSSRNQDQGHRAGWWQSWNEKLHTRWLRHPGVWSPGYHPGRAWLPGCRESCGALGLFLLQTTPGLFGEQLGAWP